MRLRESSVDRLFVVLGRYADGSGVSEQAYGPYVKGQAETIASELSGGMWQSMQWAAYPVLVTPWETADPLP